MPSSSDYSKQNIPTVPAQMRSTDIETPVKSVSPSSSSTDIDIDEDTLPSMQAQDRKPVPIAGTLEAVALPSAAKQWYNAFKQIVPIYIVSHVLFLLLTYMATLFLVGNFSHTSLNLAQVLHFWDRWDTSQFLAIATKGYDAPWRTGFFPLFPLLERGVAFLTGDTFVAGLLISNLAGLAMLIVLYRLILEDFGAERAERTVLYLVLFPTAFFLAAAYNESLFLCFALLSFYSMRRGHWWLAGLFGFLASLTRSAGLVLLVPFIYEYFRQHMVAGVSPLGSAIHWIPTSLGDLGRWLGSNLRRIRVRFDIVAGIGIPAGTGVFALYCYLRFHDIFAFSHAQAAWTRELHGPWHGLIDSFGIITRSAFFSFDSIHNVIDLSVGLIMLLLVVLCFVGPWKFPKNLWAYGIYAAAIYLLLMLFPAAGGYPLQSLSRLVLELFPAFIVLASMSLSIRKQQQAHLYYLIFSVALLSFMLLQFLTGRWIV